MRRARRRAFHPREGAPSVSTAARINPPRSPRFLRKWICCCARLASSASSQNRCPASVVGMSEPINAKAARRRNLPMASNAPPPTWTAPFNLTNVPVSWGSAGSCSESGSVTASAALILPWGCRMASNPPPMNIEANKGRAMRREILTDDSYPSGRSNANLLDYQARGQVQIRSQCGCSYFAAPGTCAAPARSSARGVWSI